MYLKEGLLLNNRYMIQGILGQGGFGITYLATDQVLNLPVAIKEYLPRQLATRGENQSQVVVYSGQAGEHYLYGLQKFLEEARILARFSQNPGIVSVRDYFEANNSAYMVMEFIEGLTLKEYLSRQGGKIAWQATVQIMLPVLEALEQVHAAGLLHRDISPDNILLFVNGQVKLLDFGAARYFAGEHSRSLSVILKPGYAPEEQYRSSGKQGAWTDVYAVAATMYRALTGTTPPESLDRLAEDTLAPPSRLGVSLPGSGETALLKALAVQGSQRFQTMGAFGESLTGLTMAEPTVALPHKPGSARTTTGPGSSPRRRGLSRIMAPAGAVAAIVLIVGFLAFLWGSGKAPFTQKVQKPEQETMADNRFQPPESRQSKTSPKADPAKVNQPVETSRQEPGGRNLEAAPPAAVYNPALAKALCEEGRQFYKQGKFAEAIERLETSLQHDSGSAFAHYLLGWSYHQLERSPDLALDSFQAAVRLKPDYALAYDGLAWTYNKMERYQEALQAGKKAVQKIYNFPDAQYNLGMAYLGLGQRDQAMQQYHILQKMNKDKAELLLKNIQSSTGPQTVDAAAGSSTSQNQITDEEARRFINRYYQATAQGDVSELLSFYSDYVDYYAKGRVNKSFIRQDKDNYYRRWPVQLHNLSSGVQITSLSEGVKQVEFSTNFQVKNNEKNINGIARNKWVIQKINGRLAIIDEKSEVVKRE